MGPVWFTLPLSFKESSRFLMHLSILASLTRHNSLLATVAVLTKQIAAFLYGELNSCKSHQLFSTMAKKLYKWSAHGLCYNLSEKKLGIRLLYNYLPLFYAMLPLHVLLC